MNSVILIWDENRMAELPAYASERDYSHPLAQFLIEEIGIPKAILALVSVGSV
jgi:hypothetical protein